MTPKQKELRDFIAGYIREHEMAPTYEEMLAAMGAKSKSDIHRLLLSLERDGQIIRFPARPRGIQLPPPAACPHCGVALPARA